MNIPWYIPFSSHQTTMLVKSHVSKIPSQWILKSFPGKAQVNRHSATNFLVQFLDSRWPKSLEIYQLEMRLVAWQAWPPDLTGECPRFGQAYRKSSGLVVTGTWTDYFPCHIWGVILSIDEPIFFQRGSCTTHQMKKTRKTCVLLGFLMEFIEIRWDSIYHCWWDY